MSEYEKVMIRMKQEYAEIKDLNGRELGERYGIDKSYAGIFKKIAALWVADVKDLNRVIEQQTEYMIGLQDIIQEGEYKEKDKK